MGVQLKQSGIFNGVTPSEKNPEYITARFTVPEVYKGNILPAAALNSPNIVCVLNINKKKELLNLLTQLTLGNTYTLSLDVECEQPNGGYKAKIKYDILDILIPQNEKKETPKELAKV